MSKWNDLIKKPTAELTDGERVAIAAVMDLGVSTYSHRTMDVIFNYLLGTYNHLFAHCDPLPRGERGEGIREP